MNIDKSQVIASIMADGEEGLQQFLEQVVSSQVSSVFSIFLFARWLAEQDEWESELRSVMSHIRAELEQKAERELAQINAFLEEHGDMTSPESQMLQSVAPRLQEAINLIVTEFSMKLRKTIREYRS